MISGGGSAVSGGGGAGAGSGDWPRGEEGSIYAAARGPGPTHQDKSARVLLLVATFQQRQTAARRHGPRYGFLLFNAFVRTHETLAQTQICPAGVVAGSSAALGDR